MNHNNKIMWLIMAGVAIVGIIVANISHVGGFAILVLLCPISMILMMAFMGGMGHGDNHDHKH